MHKSPFVVLEDFVSPYLCEQIVGGLKFDPPAQDSITGKRHYQSTTSTALEMILTDSLYQVMPQLEAYYDFEFDDIELSTFERVGESIQIDAHGENSVFANGGWHRVYPYDFTCVIFLSDYNDDRPFDPKFECYGGKLEFPSHRFSFNPRRGTMVFFPSDPRFANASSTVVHGSLHQFRAQISAVTPYKYNRHKFPGNHKVWF